MAYEDGLNQLVNPVYMFACPLSCFANRSLDHCILYKRASAIESCSIEEPVRRACVVIVGSLFVAVRALCFKEEETLHELGMDKKA